ncbi:protein phosphatase 2C domain-containing protein [Ramlibacter sp. G-1-2-2]|uniref:Protein phosphatase 2C domain-containing protein n=1 Tax=Ramlibacter agri TaxID=2728837 RepID=A0A848HEZ0_9BURK|nr:protein phosphatase 2C domain-containing protein [Ramlibacter agri]NML48029.1 protein phosphatase 2C domain-containing protein [Ramlibacter agri]
MLRAAGASVAGPGHLRLGEDSQDALSLKGWRGGWIAAVADGLGSRAQSARGARAAVEAAQAVARTWKRSGEWRDLPARQVATDIYRRWLRALPWSDKSMAATTLLLAVCDAHGYARVWQMGDGLVISLVNGRAEVLTPTRSGFGNETRALGTDTSWSAWNTQDVILVRRGDAILLMTDGISDDVPGELVEGFAIAVRRELRKRSRRAGRKWLRRELTHWATPGHTDDKTLAAIFLD